MKAAVIVVGSHRAGKSRTIIEEFKPLVGLHGRARLFTFGNSASAAFSQSIEERRPNGGVFSQSLEEKRQADALEFVRNTKHFEYMVLAARPADEVGSLLTMLTQPLRKAGFNVHHVHVERDKPREFYTRRGEEILSHLKAGLAH